jgi:oligosaccharide reducing-end xylanase
MKLPLLRHKNIKLALLLAALVASAALAGTVNSPYQVGTWQGFKTAAVSYTFDDDLGNQYSIAVPMFNTKGFKLTLFTVTGWLGGNYSNVKTAASYGHEIASHTVDHATMSSLSDADQTSECANSQSTINANVTNQKCVTLAYPGCAVGNESIVAQYYIGARGCSGQIVPSTPSDFMNISSIICGSMGINSASALNSAADSAANSGRWCVYLIHALDNEGGYSPLASSILQSSVNYMDSNRGKFWVQTFGNVVRYIRERNAVNVAETGSTSTTLTVSVTDSLDNSIYNFPVTIRRPLPSGWSSATASQGGKDLGAQIVTVSGTTYVMFDAVPNGGNVTITKGGGTLTGGTYKLIARHSGKALDATGNGTANGTQIEQWTYNAGSNQKWTVTSLGSSLYKIIGVQSGRSIDIAASGTANGTKVELWNYSGGSNQKFYFNPASSGYYEISPSHATGSCLDVSGVSTADGALVQLWQWLNGNNQQWSPQAP